MAPPLTDTRVLDLSTGAVGGVATMVLADFGAEVVVSRDSLARAKSRSLTRDHLRALNESVTFRYDRTDLCTCSRSAWLMLV